MEPSDDLVLIAKARAAAKNGTARALRMALDLTLAEIAARVGVTAAAVGMWERGQRVPSSHALDYGKLLASLASAATCLAVDVTGWLTLRLRAAPVN